MIWQLLVCSGSIATNVSNRVEMRFKFTYIDLAKSLEI
jgi:hypothetical protein